MYIQGGSKKSKLLYCVNSLLFLSHPVGMLRGLKEEEEDDDDETKSAYRRC